MNIGNTVSNMASYIAAVAPYLYNPGEVGQEITIKEKNFIVDDEGVI